MDNENITQTVISEGVKLTKTMKGFTWEIKVAGHDLDKLEEINSKMVERYGNGE